MWPSNQIKIRLVFQDVLTLIIPYVNLQGFSKFTHHFDIDFIQNLTWDHFIVATSDALMNTNYMFMFYKSELCTQILFVHAYIHQLHTNQKPQEMLPFVARSKCTYSSTMKVGNTKCTCKTCTRKKESMLLAMVVISGCYKRRRRRLAEQLWSSMWENTHNQVEQKFPAKKIPLKLMSFESHSTVLGEGVGGEGSKIISNLAYPTQFRTLYLQNFKQKTPIRKSGTSSQ